jgi:hypothetical protein
MIKRTNFRTIGVGARGKRTMLHLHGGGTEEVVSIERNGEHADAVLAVGIGRRLSAQDVLEVHDEASGRISRYTGHGSPLT